MQDDQRSGVDIEALTAEIDHRLKDADAALARDYPGERAGRQPVHTVYVPADRVEPGLLAAYGNQAQMSIVEHGGEFLDVLDGDEDLVGRVLAKLEREPIEDLRIDFEDGYGARSDDEEDETARETGSVLAQWIADGAAPPVPRDPLQEPRAADPEPRTPHACPLPRVAGGRRSAARRVRGHPAQGHLGRPGRGHDRRRGVPGEGPRAALRCAPVRAAGRGAAGGPRQRRDRPRRPDDPCLRRTLRRPPLRHLRLLRRPRHPSRPAESRAPGGRPREGRDAGGGSGDRRPPLRRLHQRAARRGCRRRCGQAGPTTCDWSGARWSAGSTRAGTCTPHSCPRGTPPPSSSSAAVSSPPSSGYARTHRRVVRVPTAQRAGPGTRPGSRTSQRRHGRWRPSCSGDSTAARLTDAEVVTASGLNLNRLTELAGRPVEKRKAG